MHHRGVCQGGWAVHRYLFTVCADPGLLAPSRNRLADPNSAIRRCIAEAIQGSLNTRINILYFLDSLAEASTSLGPQDAPYLEFISRDLGLIVERVVPDTREGVLNLKSAKQVSDRGVDQRQHSVRSPEL